MGNKINEMFAFVVIDDDGDEGILGFQTPTGWMPMVGADMERVAQLRPIADTVAQVLGKPYRVLRFELVGEITL